MSRILHFFMTKDGMVAVAGLVLFGAVAHFSTANAEINFLARVGNLCLFLYILWRAAGSAVVQLFVGRKAAIADQLEQLRQRRQDAEQNLAALQDRIANLAAEQEAILAESREQAEAIKQSIIAKAEKQAAVIREQAHRATGSQMRLEMTALRAEMADKIAAAVEKALQERLTPEEHAKLVDNSLKKVVLH